MLKNYFKIAWRNLVRNKLFSVINIIGLAVGLTCCMLICSYLYTELTYDRYAKDAEQIYRVDLEATGVKYPNVDVAVGKGMKEVFPEVAAYTRLSPKFPVFVSHKEKQFKEGHIADVDANFLQLFSIPLIEGDRKTALDQPNSIVVSKAFAHKYFGDENPVGKSLVFNKSTVFKVTGVIDKVPDKSHFHFDAFVSMSTYPWQMTGETWSNVGYYTYLVLSKNADPEKLEAKFPQLVAKHIVPEIQRDMGVSLVEAKKSIKTFRFSLMPLTQIHLYSHTKYEIEPNGDIQYVYIFAALVLFILLLACVNFINLSTANSFRRAREIGIRKVLGSVKKQLISQFLTESILVTLCAMILALMLTALLLPYFNHLSAKHIPLSFFLDYKPLSFVLLLILLVGGIAGIYPAFFLSSFQPIKVLKGNSSSPSGGKVRLRSGLVIFQFVVSICLIIATLIIYQQLHFMQNRKLGFDKDQVLVIQNTYTLENNENAFRQQLLQNNPVTNASISMNVPGNGNTVLDFTQVYPADKTQAEVKAETHINIFHVDDYYIPTLGIDVLQGRNFSPDFPSDSSAAIINQAAMKALGWSHTNPIGKYIVRSGRHKYKVIGVVKDFNYASVKHQIAPIMMMLGRNSGTIMAKIKTTNIPALLSNIENQWKAFNPGAPFSYSFVDTKFASLYQSEEKTGQLFMTFAIVAIIIAGLGLFGLATFTAFQRTKEIGIRKVLGASVSGIVALLSKDFIKLVLIAIVIATPIAWYAMNRWLQDFAYRIEIEWWMFALAGLLAVFIALLTVSFQSVKAALMNPVNSLRSE